MKEKKNGKLIFGVVIVIILALQSPVRMGVYHFFTKNDVATWHIKKLCKQNRKKSFRKIKKSS